MKPRRQATAGPTRPDPAATAADDTILAEGPRHVVLRRHPADAGPVVLKATRPGAPWAHRAGLWREARLLDRLRGPGVVELLDVVDRRGATALVLTFVAGGDLGRRPAPDPELLATGLAEVGRRLRAAGVAHGALRPDHVVLGAWGEPVLVGFGSARTGAAADLDADRVALDRLITPPGPVGP